MKFLHVKENNESKNFFLISLYENIKALKKHL